MLGCSTSVFSFSDLLAFSLMAFSSENSPNSCFLFISFPVKLPNADFLQSDHEFFLFDPRRINVALSRASGGLIIIGNAQALVDASPTWRVSLFRSHTLLPHYVVKAEYQKEVRAKSPAILRPAEGN